MKVSASSGDVMNNRGNMAIALVKVNWKRAVERNLLKILGRGLWQVFFIS